MFGKEEVKLSLFVHDMIVHVKVQKNLQINYKNNLILQGHWIEGQYRNRYQTRK